MKRLQILSTVGLPLFLLASPALAQQTPAPVGSPVRGYIVGGVGASTGSHAAQTSPALSVEFGDHVARDVQVYVTAGYHDNLMSADARTELEMAGAELTAFTGTPWNFTGRDRGRSFVVGGKYLVPTSSTFRPYVGLGIGAINLKRTILEQSRGDITAAYLTEFAPADGVVDPTQTDTTKPLGEITAGVGVVVGRAYFDFGYRFRKAFHNVNRPLEFSQFGASAGFKF
jgi:hypothetical protein